MIILKSEGGFHNVEKFIKQPHYLSYTSQYDQLTLGFTTREDGKSPYPRDAFNMARYIDDEPSHVTHHQEILANAINFPTQQWVFLFKHTKIISLTLLKHIVALILRH